MNVDTDRSYRGGNSLHLAAMQQEQGYGDVRWGTYRQIQARGGQVRKGERGTRILSFQDKKRIAVNDERGRPRRNAEGNRIYRYEKLKAPFVRQYTVFNAEQADGLPARANPTPEPLWKTHQAAEKVMEDGGVPVRHVQGDRAYYHMKRDEIVLPERGTVPFGQPLLPNRAARAGPQHGPPEDRMKRETLIEGDQERVRLARLREGGTEGRDQRHDDGRARGRRPRSERGAPPTSRAGSRRSKRTRARSGRAAADAQRISDFVLVRHIERATEREQPMAAAATRVPGPQGPPADPGPRATDPGPATKRRTEPLKDR